MNERSPNSTRKIEERDRLIRQLNEKIAVLENQNAGKVELDRHIQQQLWKLAGSVTIYHRKNIELDLVVSQLRAKVEELEDKLRSGNRVALVIGNNVYPNLPAEMQLKRAISDAKAMAEVLEKDLGFTVIRGENMK